MNLDLHAVQNWYNVNTSKLIPELCEYLERNPVQGVSTVQALPSLSGWELGFLFEGHPTADGPVYIRVWWDKTWGYAVDYYPGTDAEQMARWVGDFPNQPDTIGDLIVELYRWMREDLPTFAGAFENN